MSGGETQTCFSPLTPDCRGGYSRHRLPTLPWPALPVLSSPEEEQLFPLAAWEMVQVRSESLTTVPTLSGLAWAGRGRREVSKLNTDRAGLGLASNEEHLGHLDRHGDILNSLHWKYVYQIYI